MTSLRLALKQSLEESSGGFSPPSLTTIDTNHPTTTTTTTTANTAHYPNSNVPPPTAQQQQPPPPSSPAHRTAGGSSSPIAVAATTTTTTTAATGAAAPAPAVPITFASSSHNKNSNTAFSSQNHGTLSPRSWKKRGPGRPRKGPLGDAAGTTKKRGRPRKRNTTTDEQEDNDDPSSSENEFSGDEDMEEGEEEEQSKDGSENNNANTTMRPLSKAKPLGSNLTVSEAPSETVEITDPKSSGFSSNSTGLVDASTTRKDVKASRGGRESDEVRTRGKTVPPPHPRVLAWTRRLPVKEARQNVKQGIRVKVRFSTKPKKDGKRKKKWYGGLVSQVSKAGSKIRIKYDDGTSEVSRFPDNDVVVDAAFNGEHQCQFDFFDPPESEDRLSEEEGKIEQEQQHRNPQESAVRGGRERTESDSTPATPGIRSPTSFAEEQSVPARKAGVSNDLSDSETRHNHDGDAVKDDDPSKQKRKRGRPPKARSHALESCGSQEEAAVYGNSEHLLESAASPVPTVESFQPLVDTPVQHFQQQQRSRETTSETAMEDGVDRSSSEPPALPAASRDEENPAPRVLSIRIPKLKSSSEFGGTSSAKPISGKPEKSPRSIPSSDRKGDSEGHTSSKRIQIHITGTKSASAGKDTKESTADSQENQQPRTKGRITPVSIAVTKKHPEDKFRTPVSPLSKKVKRQRPEMSPRLPLDDSIDKLASAGSAFEKSSSVGRFGHDLMDEHDKAVTPLERPSKVDAARSARRASAGQGIDRMPAKQEEQVSKKKKRDRRRDVVGGDESDQDGNVQQSPAWVQCDRCKKWRILPSDVVGSLPERWFCENNTWDPKRATCDAPQQKDEHWDPKRAICDAPQQKDKQLVRERKRRKRQRLMEKASTENRATPSDAQADAVSDESNEHENSATSRSQDDMDDGLKRLRRASPTENSDSSVNNDPIGDKKSHSKKMKSNTDAMEVPEDDDAVDLKPRGRGRPRRNIAKEVCTIANTEQNPSGEADNLEWVQCEKCDKWRKLPPEISADELPEVWYCSMNTWNPASASCSAPEDKAEAGLTDIFNNGGTGSGKLSYRNLIFGNGRKFNRPISERTRAAESLFAAVSDDADAPTVVMYANSSAFISRSKLNQPEENEDLSVLDLMSHSHLWKELHALSDGFNGGLCHFDRLSSDIKESLKDLILHSLGSRTMSGEEVANDIQHRNWQNVPLGWAAAQPHCTVNTIIMTMCELVKEGVLECMKDFDGNSADSFVLTYRRAKSYSQATLLKKQTQGNDKENGPSRCMKFAKPWKCNEVGEE